MAAQGHRLTTLSLFRGKYLPSIMSAPCNAPLYAVFTNGPGFPSGYQQTATRDTEMTHNPTHTPTPAPVHHTPTPAPVPTPKPNGTARTAPVMMAPTMNPVGESLPWPLGICRVVSLSEHVEAHSLLPADRKIAGCLQQGWSSSQHVDHQQLIRCVTVPWATNTSWFGRFEALHYCQHSYRWHVVADESQSC